MADKVKQSNEAKSEFESLGKEKQLNLVQEFMSFLIGNKKWLLAPVIVALGLVGLLIILGSTGAAPFIYTLF